MSKIDQSFITQFDQLSDKEVIEQFPLARENELDKYGLTPLIACVRSHRWAVVGAMLQAGYSPSTMGNFCSPLGSAIDFEEEGSVRILNLILDSLVELNDDIPRDYCGELNEPVLHAAVRRGNLAAVETLIRHGAHPDWRDPKRVSAMDLACQLNETEIVSTFKRFKEDGQI